MSKKDAAQTKAAPKGKTAGGAVKAPKPAKSAASEKARKAALGEIAERIEALDAQEGTVGTTAAPDAEPVAKATKTAKGNKTPKAAKAPKALKEKKAKKMSGLDAAAKVLSDAGVPMNMKSVLAEVFKRSLWSSNGSTPEATLYAAVIREIAAKGKESRFKKTDRGLFTAKA